MRQSGTKKKPGRIATLAGYKGLPDADHFPRCPHQPSQLPPAPCTGAIGLYAGPASLVSADCVTPRHTTSGLPLGLWGFRHPSNSTSSQNWKSRKALLSPWLCPGCCHSWRVIILGGAPLTWTALSDPWVWQGPVRLLSIKSKHYFRKTGKQGNREKRDFYKAPDGP